MRLTKLLKLSRLQAVFKRLNESTGMPYAYGTLVQYMVYAFFLTHWCACLWAALPSLLALPLFGGEEAVVAKSWITESMDPEVVSRGRGWRRIRASGSCLVPPKSNGCHNDRATVCCHNGDPRRLGACVAQGGAPQGRLRTTTE